MVCQDCNKKQAQLLASSQRYYLFRSRVQKVLLDFLDDYDKLYDQLEQANKEIRILSKCKANKERLEYKLFNLILGKIKDKKIFKEISDMIHHGTLVNIDYADMVTALSKGDRIDHLNITLRNKNINPLIKKLKSMKNLKEVKGAMINIIGSRDITFEEIKKTVIEITERLEGNTCVVWSASLDDNLKNKTKLTFIYTI